MDLNAFMITRLVGLEGTPNNPSTLGVSGPLASEAAFFNHYELFYDRAFTTGYLSETVTVRLETNLYDATSGKLVWTGSSESFNPATVLDAIVAISGAIVDSLTEEGLAP